MAVIVASPFIGKLIPKFGRRVLIQFGVTLMGFSFICFGLLHLIDDPSLYIVLALIIRLMQGFASSMIQTTIYSICTNFYPDKKEALVGYLEAVTGVGLILGPLIGSFLYSYGGFSFTFYAFGSLFIVFSMFINFIIPSKVNHVQPDIRADLDGYRILNSSKRFKKPIGYLTLLKETRFIFAAFSAALGYFLYGFMEPILAFRLDQFNLSQLQIGLFFTILPVFYIPTSIVVQYVPKGI